MVNDETTFKALLVAAAGQRAELVELDASALPEGDVEIDVEYSSLNYKDALAVTGRGAVLRSWPMVPGIDLAGRVRRSASAQWRVGDRVVVNGWGLGETHWGGFSARARLRGEWLLALPAGYDAWHAMAVGTAGFTAALCVQALQRHGLQPADGPVLVTGASGGVGSIAVRLLAGLGFQVAASSGKPEQAAWLHELGASEIIDRASLSAPGKPLQRERWAGVVDAVGSSTLANACAQTRWHGAVAACGLAQGADFPASVMPFILRAVTLYGINCVFVPNAQRVAAWELLARHVPPALLDGIATEVGLSEVGALSDALLDGRRHGRAVVDVRR